MTKEMVKKEMVKKAVENIKSVLPEYWENTLAQRLGEAGSCYPNFTTTQELERALVDANWEVADHPDIISGCIGFKSSDVGEGLIGIVPIESLEDNVILTAVDPKGTGYVGMAVTAHQVSSDLLRTEETWLIVGKEEGKDIVFTFHPGQPVKPSSLTVEEVKPGQRLSKTKAKSLGFDFAKVIFK